MYSTADIPKEQRRVVFLPPVVIGEPTGSQRPAGETHVEILKKEEENAVKTNRWQKALWAFAIFVVVAVAASIVIVVLGKKSETSSAQGGSTDSIVNSPGDPTGQPTSVNPVTGIQTPVVGYYSWSWNSGSAGPSGSNIGVAFTGYTDVTTAISHWNSATSPTLQGKKYLSLGGGNDLGKFTANDLTSIASGGSQIKQAGFEGVMFDVEHAEGSSATLIPLFATAFANLKAEGLYVAITTSHTAPYQTDSPQDAIALVQAWVQDANVDIISPQLYSSGLESSPEFAATSTCASSGCTWDLYKNSIPIFAPSIVGESHYQASVEYFQNNYGITLGGYLVWEQL